MGMGKEHGEWATLNWKIKHFNHRVQVTRVKYEMLSHFAPGLVVAVKMVENTGQCGNREGNEAICN